MVDVVLQEASRRGAERVVEVVLQIGQMSLLSIHQVQFSYRILTENTIAESSKLTIEETPGEVTCSGCGFRGPAELVGDPYYHIAFPSLMCPSCGANAEITGGKDCVVKSIRMLGPKTSQD